MFKTVTQNELSNVLQILIFYDKFVRSHFKIHLLGL